MVASTFNCFLDHMTDHMIDYMTDHKTGSCGPFCTGADYIKKKVSLGFQVDPA